MRIRQSVCLPIMGKIEMGLDSFFRELASIGFAAVEIWTRGENFNEIIELGKKHGLPLCSMLGHLAPPKGLNLESEHDRVEAEVKESIDLAVKHGISGLICFSGNRNDGQTDRDAMETMVRGLKRIVPYAEKNRVTLNLEVLNSKVDHAGYFCDSTASAIEVCDRINSPSLRILYDIYHMQVMEGDVIRTLRANMKWIDHIHTAGSPGRSNLDDEQELNYRGICRAIAGSEYRGYVGHEFAPRGDVLAALREAYEICNQGG